MGPGDGAGTDGTGRLEAGPEDERREIGDERRETGDKRRETGDRTGEGRRRRLCRRTGCGQIAVQRPAAGRQGEEMW